MTAAARERLQVRVPVLSLSAAAWILLVFAPGGSAGHAHHSAVMHNSTAALAVNWVLMLAAMMAPLVIPPVRHICNRSFARRRARSVALFTAGYVVVWMGAGVVLTALAAALRPIASAAALATAVVLVWQFSPIKQRCLNRGHAHPEMAAFGAEADLGALHFGWSHGAWCVGSCWALMLAPLLVSRGHVVAMAAASLWLYAERLDRPAPPRWRLRGPAKAARLAAAQARMLLEGG